MKYTRFLTLCFLLAATCWQPLAAQSSSDVIMRAMNDELTRNIERLSIEEMSPPFFIAYTLNDLRSTKIKAVAGGITDFDTSRVRRLDVDVLVGDYDLTQEQYMSMDFTSSMYGRGRSTSIEDDYDAIRRDLWLETDARYKSATERLEKKRAAMRQQEIPEAIRGLADFAKVKPVTHQTPHVSVSCDENAWRGRTQRLSALFTEYPGIAVSQVSFHFNDNMHYFLNSEGSSITEPGTVAVILASATTQAEDGEVLSDYVLHMALQPQDLPDEASLKAEMHSMAKRLVARRNAKRMTDSYTGPVLFEDQAAAELFVRLFLGEEGLCASRMPIMDGPLAAMGSQMQTRNLGEKMGRRVLPKEITIASTPQQKSFAGAQLVGPFAVDGQGVIPAEELILLREGKVEALLADRTPTQYTETSTGHRCTGYSSFSTVDGIGPGIMDVRVSDGPTFEEMKQELLERALDEGLEYTYIVRTIRPETVPVPPVDMDMSSTFSMFGMQGGNSAKPLDGVTGIYRVNVKDGSEELIRNIEVLKPGSSPLRRCLASADRVAWNTSIAGASSVPGLGAIFSISMSMGQGYSGIPTSVIAPRALIIDDMEVREEKRPITPKPPIVASPLAN
ncbi:hypothetical protein KQI65_04915 [bacterium]|nr:hypothetical protein [bacterium]